MSAARVYTVRSRPWLEGAQVTLATCETGLSMTHPGDFGHGGVALREGTEIEGPRLGYNCVSPLLDTAKQAVMRYDAVPTCRSR